VPRALAVAMTVEVSLMLPVMADAVPVAQKFDVGGGRSQCSSVACSSDAVDRVGRKIRRIQRHAMHISEIRPYILYTIQLSLLNTSTLSPPANN
jgi:hypothetical protein